MRSLRGGALIEARKLHKPFFGGDCRCQKGEKGAEAKIYVYPVSLCEAPCREGHGERLYSCAMGDATTTVWGTNVYGDSNVAAFSSLRRAAALVVLPFDECGDASNS